MAPSPLLRWRLVKPLSRLPRFFPLKLDTRESIIGLEVFWLEIADKRLSS